MAKEFTEKVQNLPKKLELECFHCKHKTLAVQKRNSGNNLARDFFCYCENCERYLSKRIELVKD